MPSIEELERRLARRFLGKERSDLILFVSVATYVILFSVLAVLRHYAFRTRAWDLGIFTQSLWTTLNSGRFLYHTCELFINPSGCFYGVHFSPILLSTLPLYWIVPKPETLLVFQSFILAIAAFPIYKLAKENAGGRIVGLIFALGYLAYPATHFVNLYDFHVQAFLPFLLTYTISYSLKENWPRYFLFVLLSLTVEEHVSQIIFFLGVFMAWRYRALILSAVKKERPINRKLFIPFTTIALGIIWYWFTLWQRDTFFPTNPATLEQFLGAPNFTILGAKSPMEIPFLIVLRPWSAIQALEYDGYIKLLYLATVFGPLAFFSFKSPSFLLPTIPWFGFSLISQTLAHHLLGHQYETYITAFVFASAIFGLRKNFQKRTMLRDLHGSLKKIVVFNLVFLIVVSPLCPTIYIVFPSARARYASFNKGEHERLLAEVINMVPYNASILTQDNIFPHVSHRVDAYVVPTIFLDSSIHDIVVDFVNQTIGMVEYILLDSKTDPVATSLVNSLLETKPEFVLAVHKDNSTILLYRRILKEN